MLVRCSEIVEKDHGILAVAAIVEDESSIEWSCYGFLPEWLSAVPGVDHEWRRFNRAVIEAFMRKAGFKDFERVDVDGIEYDPIDFGEGDDEDDDD